MSLSNCLSIFSNAVIRCDRFYTMSSLELDRMGKLGAETPDMAFVKHEPHNPEHRRREREHARGTPTIYGQGRDAYVWLPVYDVAYSMWTNQQAQRLIGWRRSYLAAQARLSGPARLGLYAAAGALTGLLISRLALLAGG